MSKIVQYTYIGFKVVSKRALVCWGPFLYSSLLHVRRLLVCWGPFLYSSLLHVRRLLVCWGPFPLLISTPCAEVRSVPLESNQIYIYGMHVLGPLFWICTVHVFEPGRIFFGPGGMKNVEDLHVCFLDLAMIISMDLDEFDWTWRNSFGQRGYLFLTPVSFFWARAPALWTLLP